MRVLFISGSYPPMKCGVGDYLYRLAQAISDTPGIKVGVLTSLDASKDIQPDHPERFPIIQNWGLGSLRHIVRFMRTWKPDIVHIQYPTQGYSISPGTLRSLSISLLPAISFILGAKVVQTWHEHESHKLKSLVYFFIKAITPSRIIVVRPDFYQNLPKFLQWFFKYKSINYIRNASAIPRLSFSPSYLQEVRSQYLKKGTRLLIYFGFIYPHKGADLLFEIANPATDRIVFAGGYEEHSDYVKSIKTIMTSEPWSGQVEWLGYTKADDISALLSVADAVVLPFRNEGGGIWNSSVHAAITHNVFVLTTSTTQSGYDPDQNVYYSQPDDIDTMKQALDIYAGTKRDEKVRPFDSDWAEIAAQHLRIYGAQQAAQGQL